jgi:3-deoxy-D-manno-octulosonic-acid transferase
MSWARFAYTLVAHPMLLLALWHIVKRGRAQPGYRAKLGERFGRYATAQDEARPEPASPSQTYPTQTHPSQAGPSEAYPTHSRHVWVHAVSVGEVRAALPLVQALHARDSNLVIVLTVGTPTGRETAEQLLAGQATVVWMPYDLPWALSGFFKRFRPRAALVMETEVWPNMLAACRAHQVPVALANARLSEKSATGYARHPVLFQEAFASFSAILAQSESDATRLRAVGGQEIQVTGNVKFDLPEDAHGMALSNQFRAWVGERLVVLLSATREGEEVMLLDALAPLLNSAHPRAGSGDAGAATSNKILLVLVPRHPQRFDEVSALVTSRGLSLARRSAAEAISPDTQVWLGDSMGEMAAYSALSDVAVVGGSWLAFGSQSPIEAMAAGKPVVLGPHTYNFAEVTRESVVAGAAVQLPSTDALASTVEQLLQDREKRAAMGQAGQRLVEANRGATARVMEAVTPWL